MFGSLFFQQALGQKIPADLQIKRIWTDSRNIQDGDLFVAIPGEKFDGHVFVEEALKSGAKAAMVHRESLGELATCDPLKLIVVEDTVQALRQLAAHYRLQLKIPILAVAGSNGKTTTKELIAFLLGKLSSSADIFKTAKSQNSILGIAMSLLQIRDEKMAVIEIGIDEPGWMDQHLEVVQPTHGIITSIGEEHLNRLGSIEQVATEEMKLWTFLQQKNGFFAANIDSPWIQKRLNEDPTQDRVLTYSLESSAHIEGFYEAPGILHAFGFTWILSLPGKHNAQNLLAALTLISLMDRQISRQDLALLSKAIEEFKGESHRSVWLRCKNDIQVFDDCYNANPHSMESALATFQQISDGCSQKLILGDMLDLGESADSAHQRILNLALVFGFHQIYLVGDHFKKTLENIHPRPANIQFFDHQSALAEALGKDLKPADFLFFKGSRGMALEKVIDHLKNHDLL